MKEIFQQLQITSVAREGGVYFDFDQVAYEYDINMHKFDFISYQVSFHNETIPGLTFLEASWFGSPRGHRVPELVAELIANNALGKSHDFFHGSTCFKKSFYSSMLETGPARVTVAYWKYFVENRLKSPTNDFILDYDSAT